ncbi:hypothetical protein B5V01_28630 [Mesorhizobium erdmanii]|uniref:Uncharacterized protein n=2 Tax=Mesorhizobium TaxID=68287 RepID=A0A3M9X483_9HYPH|nr:hypothetical protein DNR46_28410 [Mesorhizobium japonicum]RXT37394.1 hypothetical protein B5V01_28630 [Mesorhizobium erdmanii]
MAVTELEEDFLRLSLPRWSTSAICAKSSIMSKQGHAPLEPEPEEKIIEFPHAATFRQRA